MSSVRADDHATIGSILFAVVTPALFWKRANAINCSYMWASRFRMSPKFTNAVSSDSRRCRHWLSSRATQPLWKDSVRRPSSANTDTYTGSSTLKPLQDQMDNSCWYALQASLLQLIFVLILAFVYSIVHYSTIDISTQYIPDSSYLAGSTLTSRSSLIAKSSIHNWMDENQSVILVVPIFTFVLVSRVFIFMV